MYVGLYNLVVIQLLDEIPKTIDATATGTTSCAKTFTIPSWIPSGKVVEAKVKLAYTWAATADGKITVRNITDNKDIAVKNLTGGESSNEEDLAVTEHPDLLIGKKLQAIIDITVAGGTGESVTLRSIALVLGIVI